MAGIDGDFGKFRHDAIDAKGLVAQLTGFHDLVDCFTLTGRDLSAHILEPVGGHIALLAIRGEHLVPRGSCLLQQNDLSAVFVLPDDLVLCAGAGAEHEAGTVGFDLPDLAFNLGCSLRDDGDARRHGSGHGRAEDIALDEPFPLARIVQRMFQRQFPLAVQCFGHCTGQGRHWAKAVIGEVRTVRGIDTDQG